MEHELAIGEVGTTHGKTVLCVECPKELSHDGISIIAICCRQFAFINEIEDCHICDAHLRSNKTYMFYPEITKEL